MTIDLTKLDNVAAAVQDLQDLASGNNNTVKRKGKKKQRFTVEDSDESMGSS